MTGYPLTHLEISASDPQAAGKFYSALFGWKLEVDPTFDYVQFVPPSGPGGAFPKVDGEIFKPGVIIPYIHADDIEAVLAKAETLGGKTLVPKSEIPGIGWFAHFTDPTGNRIGLYTGMGHESSPE